MPSYGIYQCAVEVASSRMYHHACRFVYHHELIILVYDIERNILSTNGVIMSWAIEHQRYHVASTHLKVALNSLTINKDKACIGSILYSITARMRHTVGKVFVYTHRGLSWVYYYLTMFIELAVIRICAIIICAIDIAFYTINFV